jgi:AcrR family transcriptional regulator
MVSTAGKRKRRGREEAESEILDAAEQLIASEGISGLTVVNVMELTGMKRAAFYNYFSGRGDLIVGLIDRIEEEMMDASRGWLLDGAIGPGALGEALAGALGTYRQYGHVLAVAEIASFDDEKVERSWRDGIIANFITAVRDKIVAENAAGRAAVADPSNTARALVLMNARLMNEAFGSRTRRGIPPEDVLVAIWQRAIYGELRKQ